MGNEQEIRGVIREYPYHYKHLRDASNGRNV